MILVISSLSSMIVFELACRIDRSKDTYYLGRYCISLIQAIYLTIIIDLQTFVLEC